MPPRSGTKPRPARALECVRRLVNALGESARAVERHTGLTNAQLFVVQQLHVERELTINELAARSLTQQSTISVLVRRLEEAGFARRERLSEDGRRVAVTLTAKGRAVARRAPDPPMSVMLRALGKMKDGDLDAVIRGVGALLDEMRVPARVKPLFEPATHGRRD